MPKTQEPRIYIHSKTRHAEPMTTTTKRGQHTPGPWRVEKQPLSDGCPFVNGPNGEIICRVYDTGIMQEHGLADARLIAAAPELLAALRCLLLNTQLTRDNQADLNRARVAIARAEGREE